MWFVLLLCDQKFSILFGEYVMLSIFKISTLAYFLLSGSQLVFNLRYSFCLLAILCVTLLWMTVEYFV